MKEVPFYSIKIENIKKKEFYRFFPRVKNKEYESIHSSLHFSKYFNWYTQEIGQFCSFLFNFLWGQILLITSQGNGPLASDFYIKDTMCINTLFHFDSDGLNVFQKESEENATIFSRKSPTKNRR
ncbi:hypothetical protein AJ87_01030 [Rhizobium yanglingense]|nr:hypothetical protein AJ87_01030 [Rhizobium yanglingense]